MLGVIQSFGEELPVSCQNAHQEAWQVFEPFLVKYGAEYSICERTTRVLRVGLTFFGSATLPIVPSVLTRLVACFEATGFSSYLWMASKIVGRFGNEEDLRIRAAFKDVYERSSQKLVSILQEKSPQMIPDSEWRAFHVMMVEIDMFHSPRGLSADAPADARIHSRCLLPFTGFCYRIPRSNGIAYPRSL